MRSSIAMICVAGLLAQGCVTGHRVVVRSGELHRNITSLRMRGSAVVDATDIADGDDDPRPVRETVRADQTLRAGGRPLLLRDLMRSCADAPPFEGDEVSDRDCELVRLRSVPLEVRRFETRSAAPIVEGTLGGLVAAAVIGSVVCLGACDDGSSLQQASEVTLTVTGALVFG
ncbi:MAG TPA: hypothetical protein VKB80_19225, partial [Kofleriaceae bacterium]|nr:hypothetical protein [Kofleriaceae bacterium]